MFRRPHHQRIAKILSAFNAELLREADCFFGGGTAIVLALDEYRESVDIDFLCASGDGYRLLRNTVSSDLGSLLKEPVKHVREVRTDQYKIYTVLEIDEQPVKVELVRESRVSVGGKMDSYLKVPVLSRDDMFAEKLLANADRGLDRSVMSRDIIDIAMMIQGWGGIPKQAWDKAYVAYGEMLSRAFHKSVELISDGAYLKSCLQRMQMDAGLSGPIARTLECAAANLYLNPHDAHEREKRIFQIDELQRYGGASYTFWRHASEALRSAVSPDKVDWSMVEKMTIEESIGEHGQTPESVIDVIIKHSPGSASAYRQAAVTSNIERAAVGLQSGYEAAKGQTQFNPLRDNAGPAH